MTGAGGIWRALRRFYEYPKTFVIMGLIDGTSERAPLSLPNTEKTD